MGLYWCEKKQKENIVSKLWKEIIVSIVLMTIIEIIVIMWIMTKMPIIKIIVVVPLLSVRSNSESSTRHVYSVHFFHSSKGVTSGDVPDHIWDSNWPYLSNSTLSPCWFRWFRHLQGNWVEVNHVVVGYKWVEVVVSRHNWVDMKSGVGILNANMNCY